MLQLKRNRLCIFSIRMSEFSAHLENVFKYANMVSDLTGHINKFVLTIFV